MNGNEIYEHWVHPVWRQNYLTLQLWWNAFALSAEVAQWCYGIFTS